MCALFQSESCDKTLWHTCTYVRTYVLRTYVRTYAGADLRRGDIKVHQGGTTWILDVPWDPALRRPGQPDHPWTGSRGLRGNQGGEGRRPAQLCPIHCGDWRLHQQAGGPSPQDVALRGVMQALVRIQAYMLADIVVAIPAVDLAVEAVV